LAWAARNPDVVEDRLPLAEHPLDAEADRKALQAQQSTRPRGGTVGTTRRWRASSPLKKGLVYYEDYRTRAEAQASIFEYLEVFDIYVGGTQPGELNPRLSTSGQRNPQHHTHFAWETPSSTVPENEGRYGTNPGPTVNC
jgi:hypothetical protein